MVLGIVGESGLKEFEFRLRQPTALVGLNHFDRELTKTDL